MSTTLTSATLSVTVTEEITLNGNAINSTNQVSITDINEIDKRIVTIPSASEIVLMAFSTAIAAGQFIASDVRYIRLRNLDAANWLRVRLKKIITTPITTLGSITAGSAYPNGAYTNVAFTGGTGSGATANITVAGTAIQTLGTITAGSGYATPGTYTTVPLTGGSGSGAQATIVVAGGIVTSVTITTRGTGYVIGNVLSASNTNLGGSGSGFSIPVATLGGGVSAVTLVLAGTGYTAGDTLSASNTNLGGAGTGFSIPVSVATSVVNILDEKVSAGDCLILSNTSVSASTVNQAFASFVDIDSINCQANSSAIDVEYFVASV